MGKELPYFQFEPASWKFGKIQRCGKEAKSDFMDMCAAYWYNGCELTEEDARLDYGEKSMDELLKKKVLKSENGSLKIKFLDDQFAVIMGKKSQQSEAGKRSGEARRKKAERNRTTVERPLNETPTTLEVPLNETEQIRGDKIRVDNIREEDIPPKSPKGESENNPKEGFEKFNELYPISADYSECTLAWCKIDPDLWPVIHHDVKKRYPPGSDPNFAVEPHNYLKKKVWERSIIFRQNGTQTKFTPKNNGVDREAIGEALRQEIERNRNL